MRGIVVAPPETPEWTAARRTGIGASQCAAACGLSDYGTPFEVYLRCRGELPEIEDNVAMRLGRRLEPIVVEEFVHETGLAVGQYPVPMLRHEEHSFMLATPDVWLANDELMEAKTTTFIGAKNLGEEDSDDIPVSWLMQVQQQMAVTGAQRAHVAVLIDGRTLKTFVVERQEILIDRIIAIESDLWHRIQENDPPEPTWKHPSTPGVLKDLYHTIDNGKIISASDDFRKCQERLTDINAAQKLLKDEYDELKAHQLAEIGDANAADLGDGFCVRRKTIEKKSYVVAASSYIDMRRVSMKTWMKG